MKHDGRARLEVFSVAALDCKLLPEKEWEFETTMQWDWSLSEKNAGGAHGKSSWLQNTQIRVYIEALHRVCIYATITVSPGGPQAVSLHAVKNNRSMSFNVHAAVSPQRHEIVAKPKPVYGPSGMQLCFEISND